MLGKLRQYYSLKNSHFRPQTDLDMDYEKKYKEALSKCKAYIDDTEKRWSEEFSRATEEVFKEIFHELRESEDERIRKKIIDIVKAAPFDEEKDVLLDYLEKQKDFADNEYWRGFGNGRDEVIDNPDMFNLQEKQKEQKPAEKQDYSGLNDLERAIHRGFLSAGVENVPVTIIKETANECKRTQTIANENANAKWSEEDERMRYFVTEAVQSRYSDGELAKYLDLKIIKEKKQLKQRLFDWLRNLRPHWKPSEEQMDALKELIDDANKAGWVTPGATELYEQLKKI